MALIVSISSHAASFDCGKARKLVEVAICADAQLSDADEKLAAAYRAALATNQNEWKAEIVKNLDALLAPKAAAKKKAPKK